MYPKNTIVRHLRRCSKVRVKAMLPFRQKRLESTPFSEFIRTAKSDEKKKVYSGVLKRASEAQNEVISRVSSRKAARR